jgi:hypothetical protein
MAASVAAIHTVGPRHIFGKHCENRVDVSRVEVLIKAFYQLYVIFHKTVSILGLYFRLSATDSHDGKAGQTPVA